MDAAMINEVECILAYSKACVSRLQEYSNATIMLPCHGAWQSDKHVALKAPRLEVIVPNTPSGRGAARLARLHGVQEVGGSNPLAPTEGNSRDGVSFLVTNIGPL
jgi:hypothetical protein